MRFLGRRVYLALVVVLGGLAVPLRTLERWRLWWRGAFMRTPLWLSACGAFMPPLDAEHLPAALLELERFIGADASARMSALLRFLTPTPPSDSAEN